VSQRVSAIFWLSQHAAARSEGGAPLGLHHFGTGMDGGGLHVARKRYVALGRAQ
jgi:hypothetical protein